MNRTEFYSPRQQFLREWRLLWRTLKTDIYIGVAVVITAFYGFRVVGESRVYDVLLPLYATTGVAFYLAMNTWVRDVNKESRWFYYNLPKDRLRAWDAQFVFICTVVLGLESLILVGAYFKIGGAGLTPEYRLHPELFVLPLVAIAFVSVGARLRQTKQTIFVEYIVMFGSMGFAVIWEATRRDHMRQSWSYLFSPVNQFLLVGFLLGLSGTLLIFARARWGKQELGDRQ